MTHAGRLSPVICPLAKLGRSSPGSLEFTPSSSVRNTPYHPYTVLEAETSFTYGPTLRCGSPCLDQGYHTLVTGGGSGSGGGSGCTNLPLHSTATKHRRSQSRTAVGTHFDRLRDELVLKIFSYLNSADLCACAAVCHRWENLAWEPVLWRTIALCGENTCGDKAVRCVLRRLCGRTRTGACPEVQRLFLSDGTKISDKGLTALARRCPELTHVQLHGSLNITNAAISELVARCPNLQHLDVTGKSALTVSLYIYIYIYALRFFKIRFFTFAAKMHMVYTSSKLWRSAEKYFGGGGVYRKYFYLVHTSFVCFRMKILTQRCVGIN